MKARNSERPKYVAKSIPMYTDEQIGMYKIYEIVLCRGVEATIRDIYVRVFRYLDDEGEEQFGKYLSFRMHEKEWQAMDITFEEIQKLDGEINFEPGAKYSRAKV